MVTVFRRTGWDCYVDVLRNAQGGCGRSLDQDGRGAMTKCVFKLILSENHGNLEIGVFLQSEYLVREHGIPNFESTSNIHAAKFHAI
jgi:hypothetical protein